jgi:hypothetical protein
MTPGSGLGVPADLSLLSVVLNLTSVEFDDELNGCYSTM